MMQPENLTVLVVDDSAIVRSTISEWLTESGFNILSAEDGLAAIDAIKANPRIDIIILDLVMPRLNGFIVTRLLKGHDVYKNIPIVIITGAVNKNEKLWASQAGAEDFILKPFNYGDLMECISRVLNIPAPREQPDKVLGEVG